MTLNRDTLPLDSPWMEKCARHTSPVAARTIRHAYYCDPCAIRMVHEAFNNRPSLYHGETVDGFCGLCNQQTDVTLRLFFACAPCAATVGSYQKSMVAASAVHEMWNRAIAPHHPRLQLLETEAVEVRGYARKATTKLQSSKTLNTLDFLVSEDDKPLFHIELKSGPMSVLDMTEFQLDVNDFDDIIGATCFTRLPTYIIHVEVGVRYAPPTCRVVALSAWWTDFHRLRAGLASVKKRRNEDKDAGYFRRDAFEPIDTFPAEIDRRGFETLSVPLDVSELSLPPRGWKAPRVKTTKRARKK